MITPQVLGIIMDNTIPITLIVTGCVVISKVVGVIKVYKICNTLNKFVEKL